MSCWTWRLQWRATATVEMSVTEWAPCTLDTLTPERRYNAAVLSSPLWTSERPVKYLPSKRAGGACWQYSYLDTRPSLQLPSQRFHKSLDALPPLIIVHSDLAFSSFISHLTKHSPSAWLHNRYTIPAAVSRAARPSNLPSVLRCTRCSCCRLSTWICARLAASRSSQRS